MNTSSLTKSMLLACLLICISVSHFFAQRSGPSPFAYNVIPNWATGKTLPETPITPITPGVKGSTLNDNACDATVLTVGTVTTFDNSTAGKEAGEPLPPAESRSHSQNGWRSSSLEPKLDGTVWFSFVAPNSSCIYIETTGFDSQIALYDIGRCDLFNSYTLLAANDDPTPYSHHATIESFRGFNAGETYYIQVDGYEGAAAQNATIEVFTCPTGPMARCKDVTVEVSPTTTATLTASDVNNNSLNYTVARVSPENFDCSQAGVTTAQLTVRDAQSNSDDCTAQVTVIAKGPPVVNCPDVTLDLPNSGTLVLAQTDLGQDNCAAVSISHSPATLSGSDLGDNTVQVTVYDENNQSASCNAHVKLMDTEPPVITCPGDLNLGSESSLCGADVTYTLPTATDNSGAVTVSLFSGYPNNAFIPGGVHTITYQAEDASGNVSYCSFEVVVRPSNYCPLIKVETCSSCPAGGTVPVTVGVYTPHLIISEVINGAVNNKYVEIFNSTPEQVNMADYQLEVYENGSSTATQTFSLASGGYLDPGDVLVYSRSTAELYTGPEEPLSGLFFDGNDAIVLRNTAHSYDADIFGVVGQNPGALGWISGTHTTVNSRLIRKKTNLGGITVSPTGSGSSGFTSLAADWNMHNVSAGDLGTYLYEPAYSISNITTGASLVSGSLNANSFEIACDKDSSIGITTEVKPDFQDGPPWRKGKTVTNIGTIVDLRMDKACCMDQVLPDDSGLPFSIDFGLAIDYQQKGFNPTKAALNDPGSVIEEFVLKLNDDSLIVGLDWNVISAKLIGTHLTGALKTDRANVTSSTHFTMRVFTCGQTTQNSLKCGGFSVAVNEPNCYSSSSLHLQDPEFGYVKGAENAGVRNDILTISYIDWSQVSFLMLTNSCGQLDDVLDMQFIDDAGITNPAAYTTAYNTTFLDQTCSGEFVTGTAPSFFIGATGPSTVFTSSFVDDHLEINLAYDSIANPPATCKLPNCAPILAIGDVNQHVKFYKIGNDDTNGAKTTSEEPKSQSVQKPGATFLAVPNPFEGTTQLTFTSPVPTQAKIEVFDMQGRLVATPFAEGVAEYEPIRVQLELPQGSGLYLARVVTSNGEVIVRRLVKTH